MSHIQLTGTVESAPNKSLGFDTDTKLSLSIAQSFYNEGYRFCIRYLSLGTIEESQDLTYEEANDILEAGLALMPVQHVCEPGWEPNANLGKTYGENAGANAEKVGFPPQVNIWCDLEGIRAGVSAELVIDYCNNWYDAVASYGYVPGLYVGANSVLNGEQLYESLKFQHYWRSESMVPEVAVRSYQMVQYHYPEKVNGISIDKDTTYIDKQGGRPQWLVR